MSGCRAVFLDRDGVLMEDTHYCADPASVRVYPGVPQALRQLKQAGFRAFIITNQSGIARGLITEAQYHAVHAELLRQLGAGVIDAAYYCPDPPGMPGSRRKPSPAMVLEAAAEFGVDLAASFFIGDKADDIECGRRAGLRTIQVLTGHGAQEPAQPDFTVPDFPHAAAMVLAADPRGSALRPEAG
jgi:D-glycero-D-manno-heptose 1,7-bisphosphate phosphatase